MIVNGIEILKDAREKGYGIGAFNVGDHDGVEIILGAAEVLGVPVMLQTSDYADPSAPEGRRMTSFDADNLMTYMCNRAQISPVPVVIHLDHCRTYEGCVRAIQAGATSVMIDASMCPFDENIALTNKVIEAARGCNVAVEAEIGHVAGHAGDTVGDLYTTVEEAKEFYKETGVDLLAVAIGTVHGVYKSKPVLQYDRIEQLKEAIPVPLVMHGSSGLQPDQYRQCVKRGICKINFATYLQLACADAIRSMVNAAGDDKLWFRQMVATGKAAGIDMVKEHIGYFGTKPYRG